jgi:NAD+ kinase
MLLAIGGDGTVLRAQRLAIPARAPVLGVAAGRLGFLAEVEPRELDSALSRILAGDCRVEQRCLLGLTHLRRDKELSTQTAVNDVVIRGRAPRSLWIAVWVDGAHVANYVADGIIAATATGSTAYSLAAGGPILAPELGNILLTPVAAHLSFVQSLVLAETARVQLGLVRPQDAYLSVDGQGDPAFLHGDRLLVEKSEQTARFVRVSPPSEFYAQLVERLQHNLSRSPDPGASSRGTERP